MSSASTIQRASNTSSFVSNIKGRQSSTTAHAIPVLYKNESNSALCCKSKVIASANTSVGYSQKVQIELANFDNLQKLYLKTNYAIHSGPASSSSVGTALKEWAGIPFSEARLVYAGTTVAKISHAYVLNYLLVNAKNHQERNLLQKMMGGFKYTASSFVHAHDPDAATPESRASGTQQYICPLPFYFEERPQLALDLGVLNHPLILELDILSVADAHQLQTAASFCAISNIEAVQYMCSLHPQQELERRQLSYSPEKPLSQIAFDTVELNFPNLTHTDAEHVLSLTGITGYVQRLYITVHNDATGYFKRFDPLAIKSAVLKSMGTDVYKIEDNFIEQFLERHSNQTPWLCNDGFENDQTKTLNDHSNTDVGNIMVMDFKDVNGSRHRSACNGGISFGGLSLPHLHVRVGTTGSGNAQTELAYSGSTKITIKVIAEVYSMVVYQTSGAGATTLRSLQQ